jgi:pimeloyl-ACP methyl ester carboxylesterase
MLRDPEQYQLVVDAMFETMMGELLPADEQTRIAALRRADQDVVLGVWELLLTQPVESIAATVDAALAGYSGSDVPYLALFGLDPGDGYADWLAQRIPGRPSTTGPDHGHYPHLVDPDRFVTRLRSSVDCRSVREQCLTDPSAGIRRRRRRRGASRSPP